MISDLLSENEFRFRLGLWVLDNDKGAFLPQGMSREEYAEGYRLPQISYVHTQSYSDDNGDLITMLKGMIFLRDWETKNGKEERKIEFYKLLKTFSATPEVEPYPMGYIIVL